MTIVIDFGNILYWVFVILAVIAGLHLVAWFISGVCQPWQRVPHPTDALWRKRWEWLSAHSVIVVLVVAAIVVVLALLSVK